MKVDVRRCPEKVQYSVVLSGYRLCTLWYCIVTYVGCMSVDCLNEYILTTFQKRWTVSHKQFTKVNKKCG